MTNALPPPFILAIETSQREGSIALSLPHSIKVVPLHRDFGQYLVSQIQELLVQEQISLSQLSLIVLSAGPGSYTGLRIGFAIAMTFARIHHIPLRMVESTQVIAYNYQGPATEIAIALDARQKEYYFATYQKKETDWIPKILLHLVTTVPFFEPCLGDYIQPPQGLPPQAQYLLSLGYQAFLQHGPTPLQEIQPLYFRPTEAERRLQKKLTLSLPSPQASENKGNPPP
ncbi:MAG: tRNA (adenosine(37)-N6)-threonylcarbamoyltransferase complex dimerization subunit type 1 TsaB [Planctomycetota bacterium]